MKETGIVRRLDELGRVVIPKEIRKTLRLTHGDPIEIFVDENEIRLKKHSPVNALSDISANLCESLYAETKMAALITDTEVIVAAKGDGFKQFLRERLTDEMHRFLLTRKTLVSSATDGRKVAVCANLPPKYISEIIVPVIYDGSVVGSVVLLSCADLTDSRSITLADFAAQLLSRHA